MIPLTPELKKQIEQRGEKIHYVTLEEFQQIISEGVVLSNEEAQKKFFKKS
jgi:hypothetical protein